MAKGIYVEATIDAPLDEVWRLTQDPAHHERWDLRFTRIEYLPRPDPAEPQAFRYATRIGLLSIEGTGRSAGAVESDGVRTSSLWFGSDDPKSLIREGSGYWRYVPAGHGTRFLTWYDYEVRFGVAGRIADVAFRPLLGWATALSFDRLRLWIEQGVPPESSMRDWWVHLVARLGVAAVFLYQGLVPKLLLQHPDEVGMMERVVGAELAPVAVTILGAAEVAYGLLVGLGWRWRWPLLVAAAAMLPATVGVATTAPGYLGSAFNAVSLNVAVAGLAISGWLVAKGVPSSRRCLRRRPGGP